ncbi:sensor domain-containing protein [Mycobacterium europaeum]|uniref:sensor domain-containing protein n=1 Tax=Mycobacterium europaeum TaxID=761804 RepID=UPI002ADF6E8A|nr:sensor domain-containing protein [Mycobacterium europaeum]MEA1160712.1 sensor domain-containing protein [Mycobacterium europaeum]
MLTTAILTVASAALGVVLISRAITSGASAAASSHREPPGLSVPMTPGLVHPEDLKNLLLSPAEAGDILHVPGMTLYQSNNGLFMDTADPPECAGIWAPGMAQVYRDTRFIDAQSAELHGPGDVYVKLTLQSLVAFPTAKDAGAVFEDLTRKWDHCARTEVLVNRHEGGTIAVGDPKVVDNTLMVSWEKTGGTGWGCQRALMPRSNVVIDMRVCDYGGSDQAVELVNKVASRIPTS